MFRGYSGRHCVSVDETRSGFAWNVSNPDTEEVSHRGTASTMQAALEAAYGALGVVFREEASPQKQSA